jgi:Xaa-Pro aminopeptidase
MAMSEQDLTFPVTEYKDRLRRTRELMRERSVDMLVLDEIEAMVWVSGYGVSENLWRCCVVPAEAPPFLIIRSLDAPPARARCWFSDIIAFKDWQDPVRTVADELRKRGLDRTRIGVDFHSSSMTIARYEQLRALLGDARFSDFGRGIAELRWRKSAAEIEHMRRVARIADAAMAAAIAAVKTGHTQRDVAEAAASVYYRLGADNGLVGPLTAGKDWDSLHGHLGSEALKPGAIVHIELVPRLRDYTARLMRSVVVGRPSQEQIDVAQQLVELQDAQIAALKPGARARDIDLMLRKPVVERGLRPSYDNITGYTVGLIPVATPHTSDFTRSFTPDADWTVEEGMTLHMYTSARGLAFSETVAVTRNGAECLTKTERKLFTTDRA